MSVSEFAEVQILSDDARRARFNLPTSCAPGFTALSAWRRIPVAASS
jgi:hypothetical protein